MICKPIPIDRTVHPLNIVKTIQSVLLASLICLPLAAHTSPRPALSIQNSDILIADFEGQTYGDWKAEGTAFGTGPAHGTLPGQMPVDGFEGHGFVNSYNGGDDSTGTLTSPPFKIERKYINFLIGGGGWANQTCMNLLIDGKVMRTASGTNTEAGGSEALSPDSWDTSNLIGKTAVIQIVDSRKGGWGHINVDQIVQSNKRAPIRTADLDLTIKVSGSHLIVPVANVSRDNHPVELSIYDGQTRIQSFTVLLPQPGDSFWLAAYPMDHFKLKGKSIRIASNKRERVLEGIKAAFATIHTGPPSQAQSNLDYSQPYRNQFHASTRRGWNNDPNGMVYANGKYHLYYQYNPFGIFWGNMHWGHLESTDLVHWAEKPIALFQKTVADMAFSGAGFVDFNNSAGLGKGTQFAAFTSTGRGECLIYSKDGGLSFTEIPENPVVENVGRDPKIFWYAPQNKWVMVVYDESACDETRATPAADGKPDNRNLAFYESTNLRKWTRVGAFTDPDRGAVFECPDMFQLPVEGKPGESRWILQAAQNKYFVGQFDGKSFHKEAGPLGTTHGAFYAAETISNTPDGRRIQVGWAQTDSYERKFPDQIVNMAFTLPHQITLRDTPGGLRLFYNPVKELTGLRSTLLAQASNVPLTEAEKILQKCGGEVTETVIEFSMAGTYNIKINGMDASFTGKTARIFTDKTLTEIYADNGLSYEVRKLPVEGFDNPETHLKGPDAAKAVSIKVYRLRSIWPNSTNDN
jgi:fructan beta-fructosidase